MKTKIVVIACLLASLSACSKKDNDLQDANKVLPPIKFVKVASAEEMTPPDFSTITDVKEKKRTFFEYMQSLVRSENERIVNLRSHVNKLKKKHLAGEGLTTTELAWLTQMQQTYKVLDAKSTDEVFTWLDRRVAPVPESLALAQAAVESAWGTSRFAKQGNNYFGQWCFSPGCGIVPQSRSQGLTHEVAKFASPRHAVAAYMRNINSHQAFTSVRDIRHKLINNQKPVTGVALAAGLEKYSEEGQSYIKKIKSMIVKNKLEPAPEQTVERPL